MINMSYCRFHNTLLALREAKNHLIDMSNGGEEPLSGDEKEACINLLAEAADLLVMFDCDVDIQMDGIIDSVNLMCEQAEDEDEIEDVRQGK